MRIFKIGSHFFHKKLPENTNTLGETLMEVTLTWMKGREDGFCWRRIEIPFNNSNPIWKARVGTRSILIESFIDLIDRSIWIKWNSNSVLLVHFPVCSSLRYKDAISVFRGFCLDIGIPRCRAKSVRQRIIPIRCINWEYFPRRGVVSSIANSRWREISHGEVYSWKYKECEDCWEPFMTISTMVPLNRIIHIYKCYIKKSNVTITYIFYYVNNILN